MAGKQKPTARSAVPDQHDSDALVETDYGIGARRLAFHLKNFLTSRSPYSLQATSPCRSFAQPRATKASKAVRSNPILPLGP